MAIEFDINSTVMVKLTPHGREYLQKKRSEVAKHLHAQAARDALFIREDEDGWSRWQLWGLMQEFGSCLASGAELPFETVILLETDESVCERSEEMTDWDLISKIEAIRTAIHRTHEPAESVERRLRELFGDKAGDVIGGCCGSVEAAGRFIRCIHPDCSWEFIDMGETRKINYTPEPKSRSKVLMFFEAGKTSDEMALISAFARAMVVELGAERGAA